MPQHCFKHLLVQKAAEEMKRRIFEADLLHKKNSALTELELEARDQAQCVVERTNVLRMEQEEEIRMLNTVGHSCKP